ncbi:MAG: reverse transcriptase-like protein, partial [Dehalococcoidia bacterium]|nr:reverse transcriptase-like protein [Dehalococcoidia bacterium]
EQALRLLKRFTFFTVEHVSSRDNRIAHALAKRALRRRY